MGTCAIDSLAGGRVTKGRTLMMMMTKLNWIPIIADCFPNFTDGQKTGFGKLHVLPEQQRCDNRFAARNQW